MHSMEIRIRLVATTIKYSHWTLSCSGPFLTLPDDDMRKVQLRPHTIDRLLSNSGRCLGEEDWRVACVKLPSWPCRPEKSEKLGSQKLGGGNEFFWLFFFRCWTGCLQSRFDVSELPKSKLTITLWWPHGATYALDFPLDRFNVKRPQLPKNWNNNPGSRALLNTSESEIRGS